MKIKETICTEFDDRGRVVRRTRTVDVIDSNSNHGYNDIEERCGGIHRASTKRIHEAIEDYYMSKEW